MILMKNNYLYINLFQENKSFGCTKKKYLTVLEIKWNKNSYRPIEVEKNLHYKHVRKRVRCRLKVD